MVHRHTPPQAAITPPDESGWQGSYYAKLFDDIQANFGGGSNELELAGLEDMLIKVSQGLRVEH